MENKMNLNLVRLLMGNKRYIDNNRLDGDFSKDRREETYKNGQHPYAVVVSCSDSRVIPEAIFDSNLGDLFVIRVAGNVIGDHELASIEYACEHLGCNLVVLLGHTGCGAIHSAMCSKSSWPLNSLLDPIKDAIKDEKNEIEASKLNVKYGVKNIKERLDNLKADVVGMIYHTARGEVEII